jgi:hypothetical protein
MAIQNHMAVFLETKGFEVTHSLGFENLDGTGNSAFLITAIKKKYVVTVELANELQTILVRGGIDGKLLPKGKQLPKFKHEFKKTELKEASVFFEKVVLAEVRENKNMVFKN